MTPQAKARKGKKKKSRPVGGNTLSISVPSGPVAPPASSYGSVHHKEQENCSSVGSSLQHQSPREYDDSGHNREGAVARSPSVKRALNGGVFLEAMDIKILRKFMMEEWGGGTGKRTVKLKSEEPFFVYISGNSGHRNDKLMCRSDIRMKHLILSHQSNPIMPITPLILT